MKVMPLIFFLGTGINCYIMGMSLTNLRSFFHKVTFIINALFRPLRDMLYSGCIKLFAKASWLFMHSVFQLIICKMLCWEASFRGPKRRKSEVAKLGL